MKVYVFTIVYNGMPWLGSILAALNRSHVDWKWIIVQGFAEPVACSSHCQNIDPPTDDGTWSFLASISSDPRITWIPYVRWRGKIAMVNEAMTHVTEECVLFQMDSDEIWTPEEMYSAWEVMKNKPLGSASKCFCRYFVGPCLVAKSPKNFGTDLTDWVRVWRASPGMKFKSHCPPVIENQEINMGGFGFDHYAYATRRQVEFKERYYGFPGMTDGWERLQKDAMDSKSTLILRDYWPYPWVDEGTVVTRI